MNTSLSGQRTEVHRRRVECVAYRRDDGLWDFEGHIEDTKTYECNTLERHVPPGEPIHEMTVRISVDSHCVIRDAEAKTINGPYRVCGNIAPNYRELIGLRIGPGFTKAVKLKFGGTQGCTHLTELLPIIATTVFQAFSTEADPSLPRDVNGTPGGNLASNFGVSPFDGCHALMRDGDVVKHYFPNAAKDET